MAKKPEVRSELKTVADLRKYDHLFISRKGVEHFAKAFGLEGKIRCYKVKADPPGTLKGLTLKGGATEAEGLGAETLAMVICDHLGVPFAEKFGRGSQLHTCCDALEQHFKK